MEEHAGGGRNGYHVVVGAFRRLSKVSNFSYLIFLFFFCKGAEDSANGKHEEYYMSCCSFPHCVS